MIFFQLFKCGWEILLRWSWKRFDLRLWFLIYPNLKLFFFTFGLDPTIVNWTSNVFIPFWLNKKVYKTNCFTLYKCNTGISAPLREVLQLVKLKLVLQRNSTRLNNIMYLSMYKFNLFKLIKFHGLTSINLIISVQHNFIHFSRFTVSRNIIHF